MASGLGPRPGAEAEDLGSSHPGAEASGQRPLALAPGLAPRCRALALGWLAPRWLGQTASCLGPLPGTEEQKVDTSQPGAKPGRLRERRRDVTGYENTIPS
ncbi:hypothetical protein E2562_022393 [Oryza meyeriana var. granulata]|uniref:Uncharacterized protein n=1 Tax=Oryza meyeriana var. granulata TaxID=110450 RepID=A0A6G1EY44_9ORYZ|nr:hypothetical protein E2562_022393 [Oryza meyeriana var. granulata]